MRGGRVRARKSRRNGTGAVITGGFRGIVGADSGEGGRGIEAGEGDERRGGRGGVDVGVGEVVEIVVAGPRAGGGGRTVGSGRGGGGVGRRGEAGGGGEASVEERGDNVMTVTG